MVVCFQAVERRRGHAEKAALPLTLCEKRSSLKGLLGRTGLQGRGKCVAMQILVSACLMGEKGRYNGTDIDSGNGWLRQLQQEKRVCAFCPEVAAGLPVPRPCAERAGGNIRGCGVTAALLVENGVRVFSHNQLPQAAGFLAKLQENDPGSGFRGKTTRIPAGPSHQEFRYIPSRVQTLHEK